MEQDRKIRVAITHGDTNGIGYELILKAFEDPTILDLCTPIVYGSPKVATYHRKALNIDTQFNIIKTADEAKDGRLNLLTTTNDDIKVEIGQPSPQAEAAAKTAFDRALADANDNLFDALVTIPAKVNEQLQKQQSAMTLTVNEDLCLAFVTKSLQIKDVSQAITKQRITEKARAIHNCLRRDLRISSPRIAVLALNPQAGEDGSFGEEEQEVIIPAIDELATEGIQAFGPYPAAEFFGNGECTRFDAVLAMYYDQGMAPFKALVADNCVELTAGLPIVHTQPTHGENHAEAGQSKADPTQLLHAIYLAIDVARNRVSYDAPYANPLPKLYHEKRDDSEKVRFAIPKAKEQPQPKKE